MYGIRDNVSYSIKLPVKLKIAALILLWSGVILTLFGFLLIGGDYLRYGYSPHLTPNRDMGYNFIIGFSNFFSSLLFIGAHAPHIIAGYWLSKGKRKGAILGLIVAIYELVNSALSPGGSFGLLSQGLHLFGISVFSLVALLIISERRILFGHST